VQELAQPPHEPREYNCWVAYPSKGKPYAGKNDDLIVEYDPTAPQ